MKTPLEKQVGCLRADGVWKQSWKRRSQAKQVGKRFGQHPYKCKTCGFYHLSRSKHNPNARMV